MKKGGVELQSRRRFSAGISLVELMTAIVISVIPTSLVGILLVGGQRSFQKSYHLANRPVEVESNTSAVVFDRVGRKSRQQYCVLYSTSGGASQRVSVPSSVPELVCGDSIEFGYLDDSDDSGGSRRPGTMTSSSSVKYAYFYLDEADNKLKIDYSLYPHGSSQQPTSAAFAETTVLADNVIKVQFSRTIMNNVSQPCVRMELALKDPSNDEIITVSTATLMRN